MVEGCNFLHLSHPVAIQTSDLDNDNYHDEDNEDNEDDENDEDDEEDLTDVTLVSDDTY